MKSEEGTGSGTGKRGQGTGRLKRIRIVVAMVVLIVMVVGLWGIRDYRLHRWIHTARQAELQSFISGNPDRADALLRLGILYRNAGNSGEAARILQHAVEAAPSDEHNWVELSRTLSDDPETMQKLDGFLKIQPDSPLIMAELARRKLLAGDVQTAVTLSRKAAGLAPDDPDVQRDLGDITAAVGNWPQAEVIYKKSLNIRDDPETRLALAHIWIPLQRYKEIIDICSPIVKAGESTEISVEQRARALVYTAGARLYEPLTPAELVQVRAQLQLADALHLPEQERYLPLYFMGESLLRSGIPKEAIPLLERSAKLAPMFPGSLYSLSRAYRLTGDTVRANETLARHAQLSKRLTEMEKANDRN